MEIDGTLYLRRDLSEECWTKSHFQMAMTIGIPFLVVWVIAFPLLVYREIEKNKGNLNDINFLKRYGLFFVGLNDNSYFWELLINNFRKVIFIIIGSLISAQQIKIKVSHRYFV